MTKKIFGIALAAAVALGTGAVLETKVSANTLSADTPSVQHGTDAAFHDGLFQGKRDAEQGRLHHVSKGRWATESNRSQFQAGYDSGFSEAAK
jgi:hypothetical protein